MNNIIAIEKTCKEGTFTFVSPTGNENTEVNGRFVTTRQIVETATSFGKEEAHKVVTVYRVSFGTTILTVYARTPF